MINMDMTLSDGSELNYKEDDKKITVVRETIDGEIWNYKCNKNRDDIGMFEIIKYLILDFQVLKADTDLELLSLRGRMYDD